NHRTGPNFRCGERNGFADEPQIAPAHSLREQWAAFEQEVPRLRVVRCGFGAQKQPWVLAIERADPGFCLAIADGAAHPEEKVAAVGEKLRREVSSLSLSSIDVRDRLAGECRADLHAPQTLVPRAGREDDRVFTVPAATAEKAWSIGDDLRRTTGGIHHFQFSAREEPERRAVR